MISQTAECDGPGSRAKPWSRERPVHTVYRPISRLMNHFSVTAATSAQTSV